MGKLIFLLLGLAAMTSSFSSSSEQNGRSFDAAAAERFADLALQCIHREYPNKISHVLNSDQDVKPPRELAPAFYGCFDWHSAVHGHWLLVRLVRTFPEAKFTERAREALSKSFTPANIAQEVRYMQGAGRAGFERPYGLAWLLQLGAELREWPGPEAKTWSATLDPLERAAVQRMKAWLPKLSHPVRSGEHSQTAFALGLTLDWARRVGDHDFQSLIESKVRSFYLTDRNGPLAYEPSGEDFLSPCLAEADLVRRVLPSSEFARWLSGFLPMIPMTGSADWLKPAVVTDPADGKLAHLDGLNLSRAWMLEGIASALPAGDRRVSALRATADRHRQSGLLSVTGRHYEGGHWLGSFAVYLVSGRGLPSYAAER